MFGFKMPELNKKEFLQYTVLHNMVHISSRGFSIAEYVNFYAVIYLYYPVSLNYF